MPRPTKYNKEIVEEVCKFIKDGSSYTDACRMSRISYEIFNKWRKEKSEFDDEVIRAEAECKFRNIQIIQKAAVTQWTAAAWWLERKYKDEFAAANKFEHYGKDGKDLFPAPIYGGQSIPVQRHNGNKENLSTTEAD